MSKLTDPYNVAVRYLREKYPKLGRLDWISESDRASLTYLDLKLALILGQYHYSISCKQELINCLHEINLELPNNLLNFEVSK